MASILARQLRALLLPVILVPVLLIAAAADIHVSVPGESREFSTSQLLASLDSTVSSDADAGNLQDTREWRLDWCGRKSGITRCSGPTSGPARAYGINLAIDDLDHGSDELLRSPHNSHITFLARSGVPGFLLWITLQLTWLGTMLSSFLRARESGKLRWARTIHLGHFLLDGLCDSRQLRCVSGKILWRPSPSGPSSAWDGEARSYSAGIEPQPEITDLEITHIQVSFTDCAGAASSARDTSGTIQRRVFPNDSPEQRRRIKPPSSSRTANEDPHRPQPL